MLYFLALLIIFYNFYSVVLYKGNTIPWTEFYEKDIFKNILPVKSFDIFPPEILLNIMHHANPKVVQNMRLTSMQSYNVCWELKIIVKAGIKKEIENYFIKDVFAKNNRVNNRVNRLNPKKEEKCDKIVFLLKDYLKTKEEKWWFRTNKNLGQYYFVLFFMRYVIFHNKYLNYVTNDRSWKWSTEPIKYLYYYDMPDNYSHTPPLPVMIKEIIKILKNNFVFPLSFKVDETEYFFDIPHQEEIENIHNPWNKIIYGKKGKRKCEIMFLDCDEWSGKLEQNFLKQLNNQSLWFARMKEINKNYESTFFEGSYDDIIGYSIICDYRRGTESAAYADFRLEKLFEKISTEKLKRVTIILASTSDYWYFRERHEFNEKSSFYISSKKFPNVEFLILKNVNNKEEIVHDLFTIDSLSSYKKPLTVFGSGIVVGTQND